MTRILSTAERWVPDASFLRGVLVLAGGTFFAQLVVVATAPVITRIYSPSVMGTAAVLLAFGNVACVAAGLRYDAAIIASPSRRDAWSLAVLASLVTLPMGVLSMGVFFFLRHFAILGYGEAPPAFGWLVVPYLLITSTAGSVRYLLIRESKLENASKLVLVQNSCRIGAQAGFGFLHSGWSSQVLGKSRAGSSGWDPPPGS